jgi:hypothetical protein
MNFKVVIEYHLDEIVEGTAILNVGAEDKREAAQTAINLLGAMLVKDGPLTPDKVTVTGNEALVAAKRILEWAPGFREDIPLNFAGMLGGEEEEKAERKRCDEAPFFSEAYLYELLGKDDARVLLAMLAQLLTAEGISMSDIQYGRMS